MRLVYAGHTFLLICLAFGSRLSFASVDMSCVCSRLLFDAQRQTERLAECSVPIPPWVGIDIRALSRRWRGYLPWRVHFGFVRFFMAISTGHRDVGNGVTGLAARRLCVFAQPHWPCESFRGENAGAKGGSRTAAAPQTAPKSHWLSGRSSFDSRCGCA